MTSYASSAITKRNVKRRKTHHPETPDALEFEDAFTSIADCPQHGAGYNQRSHSVFGEAAFVPKQNKDRAKLALIPNYLPDAMSLQQIKCDTSRDCRKTVSLNTNQQTFKNWDRNSQSGSVSTKNEDLLYLRSNAQSTMKNVDYCSAGDMKTVPKGLQKYQWNQHILNNDLNPLGESPRKMGGVYNFPHSQTSECCIVESYSSSKNIFGFSKAPEESYGGGQMPRLAKLSSRENDDICRERSSDLNKSIRSKTGLINKTSSISNISNEGSNRNLKLRSCQRKSRDSKPSQNEGAANASKGTRRNSRERNGEESFNEQKSRSRTKMNGKNSHSSMVSICSKIHKKHKIKIPGCRHGDSEQAFRQKETLPKYGVNKHDSKAYKRTSISMSSACNLTSEIENHKTKINDSGSSKSSTSSQSSNFISRTKDDTKRIDKGKARRMRSNKKQETELDSCYSSQTSVYMFSCSEHDFQTNAVRKDNVINSCKKDVSNTKSPPGLKLLYRKAQQNADSREALHDDGCTLREDGPSNQNLRKNRGKQVIDGAEARKAGAEKSWSLKQTLSSWAYKISGGSWSADEKYASTVLSNPPTSSERRGENASRETNLYEKKPNRNVCQKESKIGKRTGITDSKEMCKKELASKTECLSCKHKRKSNKRDITEINSQTERETVLPQHVGSGLLETKWAITQINTYEDGSKTYAIAQPTNRRPKHFPGKPVRIFTIGPKS